MACRNGITRIPMSKTTTLSRCSSFGSKSVVVGGGGEDGSVVGGAVTGSANHNANYNKSASSSHGSLLHLVSSSQAEETEEKTPSASSGNSAASDMAGDIRLVDAKKPRRQWTRTDRSEMSVNLLKANLAEDGCDKAQLDMAKKMLFQDSEVISSEEVVRDNAGLAVYWLIKSSEQGNEEATRLLKETLSAGRGITGQNILDVKTCISTPTNEKLTFRAARLLYQKLSNGEEFITTNQLLAHIHPSPPVPVVHPEEMSSTLDDTNESDESLIVNDEFFTFVEDNENDETSNVNRKSKCLPSRYHLLNTTFTCASPRSSSSPTPRDKLPEIEDPISSGDAMQTEVQKEEPLPHPDGVKLTLESLLQTASSFNAGKNPLPTIDSGKKEACSHPWKFFSFVNLIVIQSLITAALCDKISLTESSLLAVGYFTLWSSYNLLLWDKRHSNFKDWSLAFGSVLKDRQWTDELAEVKLSFRLLLPYLICHAVSFLIVYFTEGLNPLKLFIGMLVIFSLSRGVITARGTRWKVIAILCLSSLSNISGTAVTSIDKLLDIGGFGDFHVSSWVEDTYSQMYKMLPPLPKETDMVATSLQLILITSLVWTRKSLIVKEVVPEIMCALWIFKVFQLSPQLSLTEVAVSTTLFLFVALVLLMLESGVQVRNLAAIITMILACVISVIAGLHVISGNKLEIWSIVRYANPITDTSGVDVTRFRLVPWEEYDEQCHRRAWKSKNIAETQLKCYKDYGKSGGGSAVKWNTRINLVKVKEIGEAIGLNENTGKIVFEFNVNIVIPEDSETGSSWQSFLPGTDKDHSVPASVLISTSGCSAKDKQILIDHVLSFRSGDKVEFYGMLNPTSAGSLKPEIVNVHSFKCSKCAIVENYIEHFVHTSQAPSTIQHLHLHGGNEQKDNIFSKVGEKFKLSFEGVKSLLMG